MKSRQLSAISSQRRFPLPRRELAKLQALKESGLERTHTAPHAVDLLTETDPAAANDQRPATSGQRPTTHNPQPTTSSNSKSQAHGSQPIAHGSPGVTLLEHVELIEAAVPSASPWQHGDPHIVEVTLIRSGESKMGNHYPPDVLERALPLFEGAVAFADHGRDPNLPERSVRDIVGHYRNVRALREAGATRLRAQLHLLPGTDWLFNLLRETERAPTLCGLSIDALGKLDESASTGERRVIEEIRQVYSVDIVTRPSAGGGVVRILQSDCQKESTMTSPTTAPTEGHTAHTTEGGPAQSAPAGAAPYASDQRPMTNDQRPATTALTQLVEELRREQQLARSEAALREALAASSLPAPVQEKLRRRFSGHIVESEALMTAITEEREVLAALSTTGEIRGMGYEKHLAMGMSEYEQLQAAFDKLFDIAESDSARAVPPFSGIREAFYISTGHDIGATGGADRPLREAYAEGLRNYVRSRLTHGSHLTPGHGGRGLQGSRLTESEVLLREADVTTASFSYLLGTSMNKRLLKDYQAWPSEWQKFTTITAIKDFKQQDRVRLGAFGSLSTVAEDAAYTTLTVADTRAIYTPAKRGNLVQVTRETIINDDLYAIKQIPQKLAVAAAFTLAEFVYNLLAPGGGNVYDGHPLFDSVNHGNTGVVAANLGTANSGSALASSALQTAVIKMRKQTNMAGKPIGLKPRYLLVVPDLEFSAMTILRSAGLPGGNNNDINPMMGYAEPIVAPQLNALAAGPTSTTMSIAVADPRVIDTIEIGFVGGQANPVLLIQDMPLYGLNFTQDTISYKVRHEYGGAVVDYRGFYLINN